VHLFSAESVIRKEIIKEGCRVGTKTIIMIGIIAYRMYAKNKPIKPVNFNAFIKKGGRVHEISIIK
jgi:hypothetical protein